MRLDQTHIRMSDIPPSQEMEVILTDPNACEFMYLPSKMYGVSVYVMYQAVWAFDQDRSFKLVFPLRKLERALEVVPRDCMQDIKGPIKFTFERDEKFRLKIHTWEHI